MDANENIDYGALGEVNTTNFRRKNLMSNISRFSQEERVYKVKRGQSEVTLLIRLEQKNGETMKNIVLTFTDPANLVEDACTGKLSVAKGLHVSHKP